MCVSNPYSGTAINEDCLCDNVQDVVGTPIEVTQLNKEVIEVNPLTVGFIPRQVY